MGIEIERKFLVLDNRWQQQADAGRRMSQGYLSTDPGSSVRVRITDNSAMLNIKSATSTLSRLEYEYPIPLADGREILAKLCQSKAVEKTRYRVEQAPHVWEIDVFVGDNAGLIVAEIELGDENEHFAKPDWLGEEVSDDPRYLNMNLLNHPYKQW